jgi:hypothetical protein
MCNKQLDEFGDHAQSCKHLKGALVTRHNGLRDVLHAGAHSAKHVRTLSEPTMLSLGAEPKPELSHQEQANLRIPEHRADVAILPDPARGVNFADTRAVIGAGPAPPDPPRVARTVLALAAPAPPAPPAPTAELAVQSGSMPTAAACARS